MSLDGRTPNQSVIIALFTCLIAAAIITALASASGHLALAQDEALRCNPVAERVVDPLVVPAGDSVDVSVNFDYTCTDVERTIFFYLVVENSENLNGGRSFFRNAKDGMEAFVEEIDYSVGSQGGLIVYTANESERVALRDGEGGKRALQTAVKGLSTAGRSANGASDAVELAMEKLLEAEVPENAHRVIVIVDAGAAIAVALDDTLAACQAAADADIQVAVMSLRDSEARLAECAPEHLRHSGYRPEGIDMPPEFTEMGDGISRADQADRVNVFEQIDSGFKFQLGSGDPRDPDVFFANEIGWDLLPPPPEGGQELGFKLDVSMDAAGTIGQTSLQTYMTMFYADGSIAEIELDNPEVCVHPPGNPAFCEDFIGTLTPPAPTAVPTMTPETPPTDPPPTEPPPTATSDDPVEPTPGDGTDGMIYMPVSWSGE